MPIFRQTITLIADGQPVNAAVTNVPLNQLLGNDLYLYGLVQTASAGTAIYDRNAGISSAVAVGTPVFFNALTSRYEPAQSGSTAANVVMGICANVLSPTSGDILLYGKATVDITAAVGSAPVNGPYFLSTAAGMLTATQPSANVQLVLISGTSGSVYVMTQRWTATSSSFSFTQSTALASWSVTHNLGKYPSVSITDGSGNLVQGDVVYNSANALTINFSAPFAGVAYLN